MSFRKFKDTAEAVENVTRLAEGKLTKALKKALRGKLETGEQLAVGEVKLGNMIKVSIIQLIPLNIFSKNRIQVQC